MMGDQATTNQWYTLHMFNKDASFVVYGLVQII